MSLRVQLGDPEGGHDTPAFSSTVVRIPPNRDTQLMHGVRPIKIRLVGSETQLVVGDPRLLGHVHVARRWTGPQVGCRYDSTWTLPPSM
jgi:hypothetical protein